MDPVLLLHEAFVEKTVKRGKRHTLKMLVNINPELKGNVSEIDLTKSGLSERS